MELRLEFRAQEYICTFVCLEVYDAFLQYSQGKSMRCDYLIK